MTATTIIYNGQLSPNMMTAIAGIISSSGNQGGAAYADVYATPGTHIWTKRPKTRRVAVLMYGGGGGGGGGANLQSSPQVALYGWYLSGGGGGRGGRVYYNPGVNGSKLKSTGTIFVGTGGAGGLSLAINGLGQNGFAGSASSCSIFKDLSTLTTDQAPGGQGGTWYADPFPYITEIAGAKGGGNPLIDSGYGGDAANYGQVYFAQYQGTNGGSSANTWPMTTTSVDPVISYVGTATAVTNPSWNTFLNNYAVWNNNVVPPFPEFKINGGTPSSNVFYRFRGIFTGTYGTYNLTVGVANMPTVKGTYLNVYVDDRFVAQTTATTTLTNVVFLSNTTTITFEVFNTSPYWQTQALTTSTPNFNPPGFAAVITTSTNTVLWNTRSNQVQTRLIPSYTATNKIYQSSGGGSGASLQIGIPGNPYLIDVPGRGSWSGDHTYISSNTTTYSTAVRALPSTYNAQAPNMVPGKNIVVPFTTGTAIVSSTIPSTEGSFVIYKGVTTTNILYACGGAGGSNNIYYSSSTQTSIGGAGGFPGGGGGGGASGYEGFAGGKGGDGLVVIISYT